MIIIPKETMYCDGSVCNDPDPIVHGQANKVQCMRKTDIADKYAMLSMYMEGCQAWNILVISSDGDFIDVIDRMIARNICVMAAFDDRHDLNREFLRVPRAIWLWSSEDQQKDTIVKNGRGLIDPDYQLPSP